MFKRYFFIVNPVAGGGKKLSCLSDIEAFCHQRGLTYEIVLTKAPKHATELARQAAGRFEVIVAVGGDGTVNEVASGLIGTPAVLGIIPTGSGNDFSREVGQTADIKKDITRLLSSQVGHIDVGQVNGNYYFVNAFGAGFDGEVAARAHDFMKYGRGLAGYLFSVLRTLATYKFHRVRITVDSSEPIAREILFVAVANGTTYGGGFNVAPGTKINDGFFTVCIVDKTTKLYALRQIPKFMKGKHIGLPPVHMLTGRHIIIESADMLQAQADGELPPPAQLFDIQILPGQLNVLIAVA
jgi:YegS/Rv2252/BmrU family lipid kinase